MDSDLSDNIDFLKQLQKKKKKSLLKKHVLTETSVTNSTSITQNSVSTQENGVESNAHLEILKKKTKLTALNRIHGQSDSFLNNINSDYENAEKTVPVKRKFDDIKNNVIRTKPKVVDFKVSNDDSGNIGKVEEQVKPIPEATKTTSKHPDFYFGLSETVDFFGKDEVNCNLAKPVLGEKMEVVTADVPDKVYSLLFQNIGTGDSLRQDE